MIHRQLRLHPRRSVLLLGPRQVGKSTLVRASLPPRAFVIDLLHHDVFLKYSKEPALFRQEVEAKLRAGTRTVFVDEVQKIPALLDEVHGLIERGGVRFILTGSSARKLRRGGANMLAGRVAIRHLHPFTMKEQGDAFDLARTLRYGSLPAVVTGADSAARDILSAYGRTYVQEEVQAEALVRNLGGFARFLDVVAAMSGDIVNFSAVGRDAGIATRTVQEYYQILEDTLLGFRLESYRKSPRARMVSHPRFYLFDTGVTNALAGRLGASTDPAWTGRLFEQWVVLECWRLIDYLNTEARLFYWRTHVGAEVDLVIERHGKLVMAIEIKSKRSVVGADISGMRSFQQAHPDVPCFVACLASQERRLDSVTILPWRELLPAVEKALGASKRTQ